MERFAKWVIRHRIPVVVLVALLTVAGGISIHQFAYVESDISKYLPEDDPVVIRFNQAGERFGGVAVAMVAVEVEDVFTHATLGLIDRITSAVREIEGVSWVISLTDIDDVRQKEVDGEIAVAVRNLVDADAIPDDPRALSALRSYTLGKEDFVGTVVSADGKVANVVCNIAKGADRVDVAAAIEAKVREVAPDARLYFSGFPFWMKSMSTIILHDMALLVPFVTLVIVLILLLAFRSLRGVLLPLSTVLISSVWAMGLMAALEIPITMLSNAIPVLLIALGTAYAIHLLHKYNEVLCEEGDKANQGSIQAAITDVMLPICLAGLTTMIGFLSFLTSDLVFIQHTGVIAAFGILAAMVVALTFLPAVLSWLAPRRATFDYSGQALRGLSRVADRAGLAVVRHRKPLLLVSLLIAGVAAAFIPSLDRRFDMVSYFPPESEVRRAEQMMREKLGGNVPVWVTVEGDVKSPFVLKNMWLVEKFLRNLEAVNNPKSVASLIAEMNQVMTGHLAIPDTAQGVGNLWFNLEGKDVVRQFVDPEKKHALVQAVSASGDTFTLRAITRKVDAFLQQLPRRALPVNLKGVTGDLAQAAREARLDRIAWMAWLDLHHRVEGFEADRNQVRGWIQQGLERRPERVAPGVYRQDLLDYMLSDGSDIEFTDEGLAEMVAEETAALFAARKGNPQSIERAIRESLPPGMLERDPEGPRYLAISLVARASEVDSRLLIEQVLEHVKGRLPAGARESPRLNDDLKGDLYELHQAVAFLPLDRPTGSGPAIDQEDVVTAGFQQTGMHHISVNVDDRIVWSQLSSLALAGLLATLLLMIQFRSVLAGLLGMIPMCLTLLINFGVMGAFRIWLEPATVLIASLVIGVGIDYTIHFMSRTRLELIRRGEPAGALDVTLRTAGRAILINAVTVAGGQLVFLAGDLIPLQSFGVLLALAMVVSAVSAVTVLPAILMAIQPGFLRRNSR